MPKIEKKTRISKGEMKKKVVDFWKFNRSKIQRGYFKKRIDILRLGIQCFFAEKAQYNSESILQKLQENNWKQIMVSSEMR